MSKLKFNHLKLKGLMVAMGISQAELAERIGISSVSLNQKLNGVTQFTASDIVNISKVLDIDDYEEYFFSL